PLQRTAPKRVDAPGQAGGDQQHPDRARRLQVEERRPKLPMRDRPRDEPRQDAGRNRKEEGRAQYRDRFLHGTSFPSSRNVNAALSGQRKALPNMPTPTAASSISV